MRVSLTYFAQVRALAGIESESLDVEDGSDLGSLLESCARSHGDQFRQLVLTEDGKPRPSILVLVNGQPSAVNLSRRLAAGDSVSLLSAVAGG
jgi:MoaD family protein